MYVSYNLPSEVSLQLKNLKNIFKNKCREGEINTIFKYPMLVYEEYFNAGVSIYISHMTIFTFATVESIS